MSIRPIVPIVFSALGLAITADGVVQDGRFDASNMRIVGLLMLLTSLGVFALRYLNRPASAAYELGRSEGYRDGYADGRRVGRPVVSKITRCACGRVSISPQNVDARGITTTAGRNGAVAAGTGSSPSLDSAEWMTGGADSAN
jgi:hypothetical protein